MVDSRFTPPAAPVADQFEDRPSTRPSQVTTALVILSISYGMGWVSIAFGDVSLTLRVVLLAGSGALSVFLLWGISRGRNWTRIITTVLVGLNVFSWVAIAVAGVSDGVTLAGSGIRLLMRVSALMMLFSGKGALWFRATTPVKHPVV